MDCADVVFDSGSIAVGSTFTITLLQTATISVVLDKMQLQTITVLPPPPACPRGTESIFQCVPSGKPSACKDLAACLALPGCARAASCKAATGAQNPVCAMQTTADLCQAASCAWTQDTACALNCSSLATQDACGTQPACTWQSCVVQQCSAVQPSYSGSLCPTFTPCTSPLLAPGCTGSSTCQPAPWRPPVPTPPTPACSWAAQCPTLAALCTAISANPLAGGSACQSAIDCAGRCTDLAPLCTKQCAASLDAMTAPVFDALSTCAQFQCSAIGLPDSCQASGRSRCVCSKPLTLPAAGTLLRRLLKRRVAEPDRCAAAGTTRRTVSGVFCESGTATAGMLAYFHHDHANRSSRTCRAFPRLPMRRSRCPRQAASTSGRSPLQPWLTLVC